MSPQGGRKRSFEESGSDVTKGNGDYTLPRRESSTEENSAVGELAAKRENHEAEVEKQVYTRSERQHEGSTLQPTRTAPPFQQPLERTEGIHSMNASQFPFFAASMNQAFPLFNSNGSTIEGNALSFLGAPFLAGRGPFPVQTPAMGQGLSQEALTRSNSFPPTFSQAAAMTTQSQGTPRFVSSTPYSQVPMNGSDMSPFSPGFATLSTDGSSIAAIANSSESSGQISGGGSGNGSGSVESSVSGNGGGSGSDSGSNDNGRPTRDRNSGEAEFMSEMSTSAGMNRSANDFNSTNGLDSDKGDGLKEKKVPPFLSSLWTILEESEGKNCIVWTKDGEAFVITSPATLCQTILPKHFKHSNFQSFVRQLNVYGFRKSSHEHYEFRHPNFVRGRPDLLIHISRMGATTRRETAATAAKKMEMNSRAIEELQSTSEQVYSTVEGLRQEMKQRDVTLLALMNELQSRNQQLSSIQSGVEQLKAELQAEKQHRWHLEQRMLNTEKHVFGNQENR